MLLPFSGLSCQVAIEVEREEDEGGTVGETFTDYVSFILSIHGWQPFFRHSFHFSQLLFLDVTVEILRTRILCKLLCKYWLQTQRPPKLSIGPPHPDPVVETSSLSAVQPPEPTYNLKIKDELEISNVLSCLQIETLVYACQVAAKSEL